MPAEASRPSTAPRCNLLPPQDVQHSGARAAAQGVGGEPAPPPSVAGRRPAPRAGRRRSCPARVCGARRGFPPRGCAPGAGHRACGGACAARGAGQHGAASLAAALSDACSKAWRPALPLPHSPCPLRACRPEQRGAGDRGDGLPLRRRVGAVRHLHAGGGRQPAGAPCHHPPGMEGAQNHSHRRHQVRACWLCQSPAAHALGCTPACVHLPLKALACLLGAAALRNCPAASGRWLGARGGRASTRTASASSLTRWLLPSACLASHRRQHAAACPCLLCLPVFGCPVVDPPSRAAAPNRTSPQSAASSCSPWAPPPCRAAWWRRSGVGGGSNGLAGAGQGTALACSPATPARLKTPLGACLHRTPLSHTTCIAVTPCSAAGMRRAMLEVVASGAVMSSNDVTSYIKCTLLSALNDKEVAGKLQRWLGCWDLCHCPRRRAAQVQRCASAHRPAAAPSRVQKVTATTIAALEWLVKQRISYWDKASATYQPTPFGKAVLASGLPPEDCLVLKVGLACCAGRAPWSWAGVRTAASRHLCWQAAPAGCLQPAPACPSLQRDLEKARESFVLTTELHLTYLCVPANQTVAFSDQDAWLRFQNMLGTLTVRVKPPACTRARHPSCRCAHAPGLACPGTPMQPAEASVAEKVGVSRNFVYKAARGNILTSAGGRWVPGLGRCSREGGAACTRPAHSAPARRSACCLRSAPNVFGGRPHACTTHRCGAGTGLQAVLDLPDPHRHHCRGAAHVLAARGSAPTCGAMCASVARC